jgi:hypothetical protein
MIELKVLQAVRLKGRTTSADIATTVGEGSDTVEAAVTTSVASGHLIEGKTIRLSPEGRTRLSELLEAERQSVDPEAIAAIYDKFRDVNAEFKALVSDWQLKDGVPNTHDDEKYDAAVLSRLDDVHRQVTPVIADVVTMIPRLAGYSEKLETALAKVLAGDTVWLTRPIVDSYHTVWFELHEELILAAGLTREEEARAGHAQ